MSREIQEIELRIRAIVSGTDIQIKEKAEMLVGLSEYQDFPQARKEFKVVLTEVETATILNHIKKVVLPQAEAVK